MLRNIKILVSCILLLNSISGYSQNHFSKSSFSPKDVYYFASGYSHSVCHSSNSDNYSFNNLHEIWMQVLFFEYSVYWDTSYYGDKRVVLDNTSHWNKYDYNSYTRNYRDLQQMGYFGMKFGLCFGKYVSFGAVLDLGADCIVNQYQYTYYSSINDSITLPYAEGKSNYYSPYIRGGYGGYMKISYPINLGTPYCGLILFVSGQLTTNHNNFLSIGVMLGLGSLKELWPY